MNRFLIIIIALFVMLSGTGCRNNNSASNLPNAKESSASSAENVLLKEPSESNHGGSDDTEEAKSVKLKITIDENHALAVMIDSKTARDFMSFLPLTLMMNDYNHTEKIADLPRKLSLDGAPTSYDPEVGDICTYAPWGNFVVFYKDFGNTTGLVPLAHIESGLEYLADQSGEFEVTINMEN